jgi:small conductance mechanosensitive channel
LQLLSFNFQLPSVSDLYAWGGRAVHIVVVLLLAWIATRILKTWFPHLHKHVLSHMLGQRGDDDIELQKRATTISGILSKTVIVSIWILAFVMAIEQAGFDVGPILASAGILGLAVGFGAQNLVHDVISGLFLLLENQIRVNDVAILNGTGGLVEAIHLRTTVLRGQDGTVHIFRNGAINTLSNMTHGYSYYLFDLGVAYKEDTDHVIEVLKGVADELMQEEKFSKIILEPLDVIGVDSFGDSAVMIKARFKTLPIQQWTVGREMNRRIKKKFDEVGIELPFPHMSVYFGEASKPFRLQMDGSDREQLKSLIREVQQEGKE